MILKNLTENSQFANFLPNLTACFGDLSLFEQKIQQIADNAQIPLHQFEIDHLAVRMNHISVAEKWHTLLTLDATLLKESNVNGRPIALFELPEPLYFCQQAVSVIELPFPKGKIYPQEGWEHIEIVMPFLEGESVSDWLERLNQQFGFNENPTLNVKISQPHVHNERLPNPTIALSLQDITQQNSYCVKVHPYNIKAIIHSELA